MNHDILAAKSQLMFQTLNATSQDGSSIESVAATVGKDCNIQDARRRGLWEGGKVKNDFSLQGV